MKSHTSVDSKLLADPVHFLAFGFGAGLSPYAPGTCGSLLAVPMLAGAALLAWPWRVALIVLVIALGIWICGESARRLGQHDHPAIVLDEIAAMIALSIVVSPSPVSLLLAFVLFRVFDILKPWPIRDLDHRLAGGLGIMLDDLAAALYTAACIAVINHFNLLA